MGDLLKQFKGKNRQNVINSIDLKPLSKKSLLSIANQGSFNIFEGTIRSSKTVTSILAFIKYIAEAKNSFYFLMTGKTQGTLYKNCIGGQFGIINILGTENAEYAHDGEGNRVILIKTIEGIKCVYCFGGNDERSYMQVRGITVDGWYSDEVNLQPRSFVEECLNRTVASKNRRIFWTLNPDIPTHWIYVDYLDKYVKNRLPGLRLWHFNLSDNLSIPENRKEELKKQFTGVFYKRYIEGLRVAGEGAIYFMYNRERHLYKETEYFNNRYILKNKVAFQRVIAIDYGITNPTVFLDIYDNGEISFIHNEYYYGKAKDGKAKSDVELADDFDTFVGTEKDFIVIVEPSAESFIVELQNRGYYVEKAKNDVIQGISLTSSLFTQNRIYINEKCKNTDLEIQGYIWNDKKSNQGKEEPVKNNDHTCDALRYFVFTYIDNERLLGGLYEQRIY